MTLPAPGPVRPAETLPEPPIPVRTSAPELPPTLLGRLANEALAEDVGAGDVTTDLTVGAGARGSGTVVAREPGVVAGLEVARAVFIASDAGTEVEAKVRDGDRVDAEAELLRISGALRPILRAERTALNFLQRLSGIATLTARFVEAAEGTPARIVDTRKTTPGLRALEKYAVRCGGGRNHRFGLSDGFLLKDNHRAALEAAGRSLGEAIRDARSRLSHTVLLEVEVDDLEGLDEAIESGADAVLLDNFALEDLRAAVERTEGAALLEASGGITLETVEEVARTGVDLISVGVLTHSAPALDLSLELDR